MFQQYQDPYQHEASRIYDDFWYLTLGSTGERVVHLQKMLRATGCLYLDVSGHFDYDTEMNVISKQWQFSLPGNGVVDRPFMIALHAAASRLCPGLPTPAEHTRTIPHGPIDPFLTSLMQRRVRGSEMNPKNMHVSDAGLDLIVYNECSGNYESTAYLHWPRGESGVTLGPGYDMKERPRDSIVDDLMSIGVDADVARAIGDNAQGLKQHEAQAYVWKYGHKDQFGHVNANPLVRLDEKKQCALVKLYVAGKEDAVRRNISIPLKQCEFDALVCFTVNPAGKITPITDLLNKYEEKEALEKILKRVPSPKEKVYKGLKKRRRREVEFYITGKFTRD